MGDRHRPQSTTCSTDRGTPRPAPTGMGVGALSFHEALFLAAGNDMIALKLDLSIETIVRTLQVMLIVIRRWPAG